MDLKAGDIVPVVATTLEVRLQELDQKHVDLIAFVARRRGQAEADDDFVFHTLLATRAVV
jgi:hypothetical protein